MNILTVYFLLPIYSLEATLFSVMNLSIAFARSESLEPNRGSDSLSRLLLFAPEGLLLLEREGLVCLCVDVCPACDFRDSFSSMSLKCFTLRSFVVLKSMEIMKSVRIVLSTSNMLHIMKKTNSTLNYFSDTLSMIWKC